MKTALLYGGTATQFQRGQLARGCNILVATPGRLLDFAERGHVTFSGLQFLVLDEADRMLDMGFMPDVRRCVANPSMPRKDQRQTLMFSATFAQEVQRSADEFLNNYLFLQVTSSEFVIFFSFCPFIFTPAARWAWWAAPARTWRRFSTASPSTRRRTRLSPSSTRRGFTSRDTKATLLARLEACS